MIRPRFTAALGAVGWLLFACQGPEPGALQLTVRVTDGGDQPVVGATIWVRGRTIGSTDTDGMLRAEVRGDPDEPVDLATTCPDGYRGHDSHRSVRIRPATGDREQPLQLAVRCDRDEVWSSLVVRAQIDDAPAEGVLVRVDGELVGQTDAEGTEHVLLTRRSGSRLSITLNAGTRHALVEPVHVRSALAGPGDGIILVQRGFTKAERKKRSGPGRRRGKAAARTGGRPIRIR